MPFQLLYEEGKLNAIPITSSSYMYDLRKVILINFAEPKKKSDTNLSLLSFPDI